MEKLEAEWKNEHPQGGKGSSSPAPRGRHADSPCITSRGPANTSHSLPDNASPVGEDKDNWGNMCHTFAEKQASLGL